MTRSPAVRTRRPEDREIAQLYRRIALILRAGFLCAVGLMLLGVVVALVRGQTIGADVKALRDMPAALPRFESQAILDLGILVLLATPPAFVFVGLLTFVRQRDWPFVSVCAVLILILAGSVGLALL